LILLLALCGFLFFYGLNAGELYRTESLRAIIAAEFLRSGNWIVPTLYGAPLFTKPPGMYAAIAAASWLFGEVTEWTARLPSALAATITVLLVYLHFGRQLGHLGGYVAALILPASLMWLDKASAAEIDMMQVAWVTAAVLCLLRALEEAEADVGQGPVRLMSFRVMTGQTILAEANCPVRGGRLSMGEGGWWLAALLCVAGGFLTKWTAPAFFYGTAVPLLWLRGRLRLLWGWRHVLSALLAASTCLAWTALAVALAGWRTFSDTVGQEAAMRLLPTHHHRPYPWLESLAHPFVVFGAALPFGLVALLTLLPGFAQLWNTREQRLLQALHCWLWPNLVFWCVIPEHAARHSFPMLPAIAGLAAFVWLGWLTGKLPWKLKGRLLGRPGRVLIGILAGWLIIKLVFVHGVIPQRNQNRNPHAKGEQLAAAVPANRTLYLFRLKDEGIMFYYGRVVRRLSSPSCLPSSAEPLYCILDESEWRQWDAARRAQVVLRLRDEQGAPVVLIKTGPN
jgi:4-amino-4-deoxy-L-arabinose transferase-like glycosyltransferase